MQAQEMNIKNLTRDLNHAFPDILFAFLFGSSQKGTILPGSDIDLALYIGKTAEKIELLPRIIELTESAFPGNTCDITFLNTAGPMVAFEALRGTKLFIREESMDIYTDFYSLTCRLFEDHICRMKKQLEYRGYDVQWDY